nr:MAG TPA: protein of unknown function (DUF4580) [Caudoviricetes sp.]
MQARLHLIRFISSFEPASILAPLSRTAFLPSVIWHL